MADDMSPAETGSPPALVIEPRFKRVMPWTLVVLAVALAVYAARIQQRTTVRSRVTVSGVTPSVTQGFWWGGSFYGPGQRKRFESWERAHGGRVNALFYAKHPAIERVFGMPPILLPTQARPPSVAKITTTESGPSDTVVDLLFGLAAVLLLGGAFYSRITKISFPGGGLEMGAVALDFDKIAKAVAGQVTKEIQRKPQAERPSGEEIAVLAAQATARAQQRALQVRSAVVPRPLDQPIAVEAKDVTYARRGMPLSDELVKRLAERAVQDVFGETAAGDG